MMANDPERKVAMKRIEHCIVAAALLVGAPACVSEPDSGPGSLDEQERSSGDSPQLLQNWHIGENAQTDNDFGEASITADCVFIEWCNRPPTISPDIGTVCRVRSGCAWPPTQAIVNECTGDANAVCGGITQPAWICRAGHTCPPG